jgi:hypothetical protein
VITLKGKNGAPGEIRTPGLLVRSQTLYPAELRAHLDFYYVPTAYSSLGFLFKRGDLVRKKFELPAFWFPPPADSIRLGYGRTSDGQILACCI